MLVTLDLAISSFLYDIWALAMSRFALESMYFWASTLSRSSFSSCLVSSSVMMEIWARLVWASERSPLALSMSAS